MKKCNACGEVKINADMVKNKRAKDGLGIYCMSCQRRLNKSATVNQIREEHGLPMSAHKSMRNMKRKNEKTSHADSTANDPNIKSSDSQTRSRLCFIRIGGCVVGSSNFYSCEKLLNVCRH